MSIVNIILDLKNGQIARATFRGERWYVINENGIRYCDLHGNNVGKLVELTQENIIASYDIIG